jgi:hypothetical protein
MCGRDAVRLRTRLRLERGGLLGLGQRGEGGGGHVNGTQVPVAV